MAELKATGKTIRAVAVELGLSKSTVGRLFKEIETVPTCPTVPRVPAALMRRKGLLPEEWELSQCLFGEHLLSLYPDRTVALVESEKTAVICAGFIPEYVWLATGGKTSLGNKLDVLSGRKVVAYPDVDAYGFWCERLSVYSNIKVSDYLQHIAGNNPSFRHMDLADLILESRRHPDTSQNPTFQQIKRYISPEYHSEAEALIDDLGLEFLGVDYAPSD